MRRIFIISVLTTLSLLQACSGTSDAVKTQEAVIFDPLTQDWPHDISDIERDPDVTYGKLDNGLRYALRKNARPEGEAVIRFWIRAGSRNETSDTIGLAHYLEHMAFNGSENVPEGEMVKSLERLGLSFGADTNASTTYMRTEYRLNLPNLDEETLNYGLFVMRETADKLLIEQDAVDRERGVVKAEEARGNTPARDTRRAYVQWAYPDRRSTEFNVIGSPETLDAINAKALRAYYDAYYRPERSVLVIVGDFEIADMERRIKEMFGDWETKTKAPSEPDDGSNARDTQDVFRVYDNDELTTAIYLTDDRPSTYSMDSQAQRLQSFKRGYANAIVNQRISKKLLGDNAPVLGAGISYSVGEMGDYASGSVSAKEDNWAAGLDLISYEIRQALKYGFQQAEYEELLAQSQRSLTDSANYAAKRHTNSLASGIIGSFAGSTVLTTPQQRLERFEETSANVTLEDLETAFQQMWTDFDPYIWLQGPNVDTVTPDAIKAAYNTARVQAVTAPETREKLDFAYNNFGKPGKVVATKRVEDFDIDQLKFDNNVYLNLKKTDFEDDWIRLNITIGEGWNAFPADMPGLTSLASSLALGGFEAHPVSDLSQIFAGKNIGLSFNVGSKRLVMSGSTNPEDVFDQLKVWTALLTSPGYRPVWQEKFKDSISASFHTIDSTPGGVASRDLGRIWANGDRRYGMVTKAEYLSYTLDDVQKTLAPMFKDGAIEISIVGDFEKDDMIDYVSKTFGALPQRRAKYDLYKEAFQTTFPEAAEVTLTHTGADNQGAIYMAWPTSEEWTIERSRHYSLIRHILKNRMIDVIREEKGLSYSPSAGLKFAKISTPYGYVSASISADPQFFDAFETAAIEIVAELRSGDITQDELDRARKPILESMERGEKENGSWLSLVSRSQTNPKRLKNRRSRQAAYEGMTPEALNTYAGELFDATRLHVVKILPDPEVAAEDANE